ncbi:P-loop containing nucleoside triphosphate hydrolase protein [Jaminaea rosea]|uniref:P-loop containing nucleoside triphosphate hydrolase protein n=1 Tax=Jaminaea rosea TaxID=1569628 RepID=A0A316V196_9BASI|nr:P-loop containing nucleoside triphosphate hydrolase protein [Jaminaea rosea]PWN31024.1 P-loop containing nucleoside triphosphate hydrolase protein [Jaminaea rosea]
MIASRSLAVAMRCRPASSPSIVHRYAHTRTQKAPAAQRRADNWLDDVEPLRKPAAARTSLVPFGLPAPRQLVAHLDDHVIGQERAKKYLAVALFNHYVRVLSNEENDQAGDFEAASGYVGEDVDVIGRRLIAEARRICEQEASETGITVEESDVVKMAQRGIVYIDEVDKLAARRAGSGAGGGGTAASGGGGRDIGGEAVQQALLRILEGCILQVQGPAPRPGSSSLKSSPPSSSPSKGKGRSAAEAGVAGGSSSSSESSINSPMSSGQPTTYNLDTSSVLFVLSGAFVGIEDLIRQRLGSSVDASTSTSTLLSRHLAEADLLSYGLIPEFLGRVPSICPLLPLSEDEMVRILIEPRNSLVEQYRCLLALSGVELKVTKKGLREIAKTAMHGEQREETATGNVDASAASVGSASTTTATGARGLRGILESLLLEVMFLSPGGSIRFALIDADAASGKGDVKVWSRGGRGAWLNAWAEEEEEDSAGRLSGSSVAQGKGAKREQVQRSRDAKTSSRPSSASTVSATPTTSRASPPYRYERYIDPTSQSLIDAAESGGNEGSAPSSSNSSVADRPSRPRLTAAQIDVVARRKSRARLNRPSRVGNVRVSLVD